MDVTTIKFRTKPASIVSFPDDGKVLGMIDPRLLLNTTCHDNDYQNHRLQTKLTTEWSRGQI